MGNLLSRKGSKNTQHGIIKWIDTSSEDITGADVADQINEVLRVAGAYAGEEDVNCKECHKKDDIYVIHFKKLQEAATALQERFQYGTASYYNKITTEDRTALKYVKELYDLFDSHRKIEMFENN